MLQEMRYVEQELLPMLRERKKIQEMKAQRQLSQWRGTPGVCTLMLSLDPQDVPELRYLPVYDNEEIHYDIEKMFISQLRGAVCTALADGDAVPSVRANVGCGCVNTLIGGLRQNFFPDKMPWLLKHLTDDELNAYTEDDITESDEFRFGMEAMRFMKEELRDTGIEVYPIDIQGPVDLAHLWLGNEFFYLVYDDPDVIHHALDLAVRCDIYAFDRCMEIIQPEDHVCHYNGLVLPAEQPIKISEDSTTLICKEHIDEFMIPYSTRLLAHYGGGYIHYCGDNRYLLPVTETLECSIGLNFGNPERHDFTEVLKALAENGKSYIATGPTPFDQAELIRAAAKKDGSFNLFLYEHCRKADQERMLEKRDEAVRKAIETL